MRLPSFRTDLARSCPSSLLPALACLLCGCAAARPAAPLPAAPSTLPAAPVTDIAPHAAPAVRTADPAAVRAVLERFSRRAPAGEVAFYWGDLTSGGRVAVRPEKIFRSASLIKLPVAAAVLARWEQDPGGRTPEREQLLWKMIAESNNVAVDLLAEYAGGLEAINRFCREQGWNETEMNYYFRDWRTRRKHNLTSARDVAAMLRAIDRRELVSPAASEHLWRLLLDQSMRQRIPAGIPRDAGAEVGNKTGTLVSALHDAAIVRSPQAHYLLVILTANPRSEPAGDAYCREVSSAVWEAVNGR